MLSNPPPEELEPLGAPEAVSVQVDEIYAEEVDADDLAQAIAAVLLAEGRPEGEVTLVVTGDEQVQALNRQYLGEDHPTDVLSFAAQESRDTEPVFVTAPEADVYLGDIVIAFPFARRQALQLGNDLVVELRLLAVHGTLHLLGYDHADPAEEAEMWARQDRILAELAK
jgi:probable rRNA maturation factor